MVYEMFGGEAPEGKHGFLEQGKLNEEAGENVFACTVIVSADENKKSRLLS